MTYQPHGRHLVAGDWVETEARFASAPVSGSAHSFCEGSAELIDRACLEADEAFLTYGWTSREARAGFLEAIADEIEASAEALTAMAMAETGLPEARLIGERGRTTGQLRYFAAHIRKTDHLDLRHDPALPERAPLPRPDLRMMQRPIGPVAVFGASNFPLAFSVAGGDTAAALAAGCPVVVKGHPAHPGTCEIVAGAIAAAIAKCGMPAGVVSMIHGAGYETGMALVQHPLIRAVGFTGSLRGGRALFDLCAARPEPIPFFGELGSINPVFLMPAALDARAEALAQGWAGSLTMGAGQFCTNPGLVIVPAGEGAEQFIAAARAALENAPAQHMLTDAIASACRKSSAQAATLAASVIALESTGREARPTVLRTTAAAFLQEPHLHEEIFGPFGLVVTTDSPEQMVALAKGLSGQLTATLHMDAEDSALARALLPVLERKAGRILANGWPTGVEVADAMVHGGPYPASTNFGATSVGSMSIRRFLRPVCFQGVMPEVLPEELQSM